MAENVTKNTAMYSTMTFLERPKKGAVTQLQKSRNLHGAQNLLEEFIGYFMATALTLIKPIAL